MNAAADTVAAERNAFLGQEQRSCIPILEFWLRFSNIDLYLINLKYDGFTPSVTL